MPLPADSSASELLRSIEPGLILDLAAGVTDAKGIFAKHGYSPEQTALLMSLEPLTQAVTKKRAEMDREGLTHQFRALHLADEALSILAVKLTGELPTGQLLEVYRELKKSGRMDQADIQQQSNLPSFQIVINTGDPASSVTLSSTTTTNAVEQIIEGTSTEVHDLPTLSSEELGNLGALLAHAETCDD